MFQKVIGITAIVAAVLLLPATADAHADADRSLPEMGSVVNASPAQVEIWFTEELAEGSTAEVTGPDGTRVDNDDADIDLFDPERKHLVVTLKSALPPGEYTVTWTSVSGEDDDTESGSFTFTIAASATPIASPSASPEPATPSPTGDSAVVTRTNTDESDIDTNALLIALAVGAGAAALIYGFWLLVKPRKAAES